MGLGLCPVLPEGTRADFFDLILWPLRGCIFLGASDVPPSAASGPLHLLSLCLECFPLSWTSRGWLLSSTQYQFKWLRSLLLPDIGPCTLPGSHSLLFVPLITLPTAWLGFADSPLRYDFLELRVPRLPLCSQFPSVHVTFSWPSGMWTVGAEQGQHSCKGPPTASVACSCLQPFKNVKMVLNSRVVRRQITSLIWPRNPWNRDLRSRVRGRSCLGGL